MINKINSDIAMLIAKNMSSASGGIGTIKTRSVAKTPITSQRSPCRNSFFNLKKLFRQGDLWLVIGVFATLLVLIVPIPPLALDMFLAISIAMSLLILLIILYVEEPADFTSFPTLLLFVTL